jgi:hypothetical protein
MRITESQLRKAVRQQIVSILKEEEEQNQQMDAPAENPAPEEAPEEQGPSKGTMFAQKVVEKLKQDSELTSAESVTDMVIVFLNSMNFSNETKLQILRNAKTETVR